MNKNNKAILLWSWHSTSSPSLNFPPFFSGAKVVDFTNTGIRAFFWKGSIPYTLHLKILHALKLDHVPALNVDPAKAVPQSQKLGGRAGVGSVRQNCNQKTHQFSIITKITRF